ncbi:MAG: hypothetical protein MHM6MM_006676 [Cercozoa sp. M6MM]
MGGRRARNASDSEDESSFEADSFGDLTLRQRASELADELASKQASVREAALIALDKVLSSGVPQSDECEDLVEKSAEALLETLARAFRRRGASVSEQMRSLLVSQVLLLHAALSEGHTNGASGDFDFSRDQFWRVWAPLLLPLLSKSARRKSPLLAAKAQEALAFACLCCTDEIDDAPQLVTSVSDVILAYAATCAELGDVSDESDLESDQESDSDDSESEGESESESEAEDEKKRHRPNRRVERHKKPSVRKNYPDQSQKAKTKRAEGEKALIASDIRCAALFAAAGLRIPVLDEAIVRILKDQSSTVEMRLECANAISVLHDTHQASSSNAKRAMKAMQNSRVLLRNIKRDAKKESRAVFRDACASLSDQEVVHTVKVYDESVRLVGSLVLCRYHAVRAVLRGAIGLHLRHNDLLRQMLDIHFVEVAKSGDASKQFRQTQRAHDRRFKDEAREFAQHADDF